MDFATSAAYLGLAPGQTVQPAAHLGLWPAVFSDVPVLVAPTPQPRPEYRFVPYARPRVYKVDPDEDRELPLARARDDDEALLLHLLKG